MTNLVDNIYDIFAKGGKLGSLTVTRNTLPFPYGSDVALLSEHGLPIICSPSEEQRKADPAGLRAHASHPRKNYQGLRVDPAKADALIISHGHVDHYGGLLDLAGSLQGHGKPGLTSMLAGVTRLSSLGRAADGRPTTVS